MPTVFVPTPYRGPTRGEAEIAVVGSSVHECLLAVEEQYPGFLAQVIDPDGTVHRFVKLFKNGEKLDPGGLRATVESEDRIEVLAAIAGG